MKELEERKLAFKERVYKHDKPIEMLDAFFDYWSAYNEVWDRMEWEVVEKRTKKDFHIGRRLGTWQKNGKKYGVPKRESRSITQRLLNG